jgi:hypothetical protein
MNEKENIALKEKCLIPPDMLQTKLVKLEADVDYLYAKLQYESKKNMDNS